MNATSLAAPSLCRLFLGKDVQIKQPAPPLERRRVVVRGQQLKRLENCAQRDDGSLDMKSPLVSIVAAVVLVGCGGSQPPEPPTAKAPNISIHEAAMRGNIEAVKQHLDAGANVNAMRGGGTPLHLAASWGHKEVAELLIDNGADVNAKDIDGWTPLRKAAWHGRKEIVELLIANGADVNPQDVNGWTPLHQAARNGHKEIAELLIAKGADVNAKNEDGETPLDWAINFKKTETADLLRKHGGKTAKELKAEGK